MSNCNCGSCSDCGDTTPQPLFCNPCCYWISQGQCFLSVLDDPTILEIMKRSPQARADAIECQDSGCCGDVSYPVQKFLEKDRSIKDCQQLNDEFQAKFTTNYQDNHRYIGPGVFKEPQGQGDD